MNSRLNFLAIAACCAALSGCDWGGVSDEENWNEGYSWLNFSGTYLLQNAVEVAEETETETETEVAQPTTKTEQRSGSAKGSIKDDTGWSTTLNPVGKGIVPGTVCVTVSGEKKIVFSDDGSGNLNGSAPATLKGMNLTGSVSYSGGGVRIGFGGTLPGSASISVSYNYYIEVEGATPLQPGNGGEKKVSNEEPIVYLTVNQKGNSFSMKDNNGVSYSGRITSVSCTRDAYQVAGDKSIAFEVSGSNGSTIVGSLTGTTSAANSESTVTVTNRRISGTYRHGKNSANFVGTAK